jgi:hypothetical protein
MRISMRALLVSMMALGLAACADSSPPAAPHDARPAATSLHYSEPLDWGWRLVSDPASTATRLVLDLMGPEHEATRGVGFNLQAPAAIHYGLFQNGLPINDTGFYVLTSTTPEPAPEPLAIIGGVLPGHLLSVGIYQKDRAVPPKSGNTPLCQIALELDLTAGLHADDKLPVSIPKARVIPADIGASGDNLWTLTQKARMTDIEIAVGKLEAR